MDDLYGSIRKSPWSILFFAIPAIGIVVVALGLMVQETGSVTAALRSTSVLISCGIALIILVCGAVFVPRPIITLTPEALLWPNGKKLNWAEVVAVEEGQSTSTVASANTGPRSVVHEVVRLHHANSEVTKIVTTWAAAGPQAASDRIKAAFAKSR